MLVRVCFIVCWILLLVSGKIWKICVWLWMVGLMLIYGFLVVVLIKMMWLFFKWGNKKFCLVLFNWWILFSRRMIVLFILVFLVMIWSCFLLLVVVFSIWKVYLVELVMVFVILVLLVFGGLYRIIDDSCLVLIIWVMILFGLINCCWLIMFFSVFGCIW